MPSTRRRRTPRSLPPGRSRGGFAAIVAGLVLLAAVTREARPAPKAAASKPAAAQRAKAAARPAKEPPLRLPEAVLAKPSPTAIKVKPVDRAARRKAASAAARIDSLLEKHWQEHGVEPAEPLGDAHFVRRIYLELGGRIPTFDETVAFLDARGADKRAELIDRLLESPDYVSHFYNFWADILRLCERPQNDVFAEPYLDWVKQSIADDKPYDAWVREMLTADGKIWENPATGYQLRDRGMPLPYVDNTVRVFLGTQIGCAQCHDHPFDSWTQHQFYELAAFTSGTRMRFSGVRDRKGSLSKDEEKAAAKAAKAQDAEGVKRVRETMATARQNVKDRKVPGEFNQFIGANLTSVSYEQAKLLLPHDYQYSDAKPLAPVEPGVLWGEVPAEAREKDGREQFAAWLTSRGNRQFARTIANRLWRKLMGVGLVEPIDDFREENAPSYPALLEHLTDEILRLDFDLREFVRIVVSTQAWQRRAVLHDPTSGPPFRFTGPALRRMTAEQLWDSILALVARNPLPFQRPAAAAYARAADVDLARTSYAEVEAAYRKYAETFSPGAHRRDMSRQAGYQGQVLVRASELPTPLPLGHFLRQFGQSDRQSIEGGRTIATVPQILAMFNGPITHSMLERGSVIYDEVMSHEPKDAVDVIFISLLSHRPSAEDRSFAIREIRSAESPAAGCGNLIWALLNTREFIFIQ